MINISEVIINDKYFLVNIRFKLLDKNSLLDKQNYKIYNISNEQFAIIEYFLHEPRSITGFLMQSKIELSIFYCVFNMLCKQRIIIQFVPKISVKVIF